MGKGAEGDVTRFLQSNTKGADMALKDDPKVQELIAKAEARGANNERKRINAIVADTVTGAGELEDGGQKKAVKAALKDVKTRIRDEA